MKLRLAIGLSTSALALTALSAAPASASEYSLDTVSARMMSTSQASSLGVAGNHVRDFQVLTGTKESPDDFWLCDLAGGKQVEVEGSSTVYVVAYASAKGRIETVADQELYSFATESDARKAMKSIRKAATRCSGTFTIDDEGLTFRQKLSNGRGTAPDGAGFTWIKSSATASGSAGALAEHEYNTFRRVGSFVQVVSLENAGPNAPKLTSSQIKGVDGLTGTLGANWGW
jgi:hypothetical protein